MFSEQRVICTPRIVFVFHLSAWQMLEPEHPVGAREFADRPPQRAGTRQELESARREWQQTRSPAHHARLTEPERYGRRSTLLWHSWRSNREKHP